MITTEVVIIGAGAAGLMCAYTAAKHGRAVVVLDHAKKAGEKIRISGGGRCNFTNRYASSDHYLSNNPHFCKSALAQFTPDDFIAMVEDHGIGYHEREHHQLFCNESARDIIAMLEEGCRRYGVRFYFQCTVERITPDDGFTLTTSQGGFQSASLVVATGGLSIPKIGASAFGFHIAQQFGLKLIPTRAALVPFTLTGKEKDLLQPLSGVALPVAVSCRGQTFAEAMLFTHRGLSGPAMLQISNYWQEGDVLSIDLLPDVAVADFLWQQKKQHSKTHLQSALNKCLPKRLCAILISTLFANKPLAQLNVSDCLAIEKALHDWTIKPSGTEGYRTAEVTLGGVDTDAFSSKTMECKTQQGLYFIGEVLDVTGQLGGFNFQWAWSSAYCAGLHA